MRILQSSLFRALCAIAIGMLLLVYPGKTTTWITILIGVLFLCSGALTCTLGLFAYYNAGKGDMVADEKGKVLKSERHSFPLMGIGSLILGLILILMPEIFCDILVYILAVALVFGAVDQLMVLDKARRIGGVVEWGFWVCPLLILLAAIIAIFRPSWVIDAPVIMVGVSMVAYGLVEVVNLIKVYKVRKYLKANM